MFSLHANILTPTILHPNLTLSTPPPRAMIWTRCQLKQRKADIEKNGAHSEDERRRGRPAEAKGERGRKPRKATWDANGIICDVEVTKFARGVNTWTPRPKILRISASDVHNHMKSVVTPTILVDCLFTCIDVLSLHLCVAAGGWGSGSTRSGCYLS